MRVSHTTSQYPESCPSGRRCSTRNAVYVMYLGFESLTLRHKRRSDTARCCFFFYVRDSNKEGADAVCGRKQSGGLFLPTWSRSAATRRHTAVCRKIPNSPPFSPKAIHCFWRIFYNFFKFTSRFRLFAICFRNLLFQATQFRVP